MHEIAKRQKNIAMCSIGNVRMPKWLHKNRDFDICLIFYGDNKAIRERLKSKANYFIENKAFKMPNYLKAINRYNLLDKYDSFLLIDDDIVVSEKVLADCFYNLKKFGLDVCQPSITSIFVICPHLKRKRGVLLEYTNFVEATLMCFSKNMLEKLLPHWHLFYTGTGFCKLIAHLSGDRKKVAVFHNMTYLHPTRTRFNKSKIRPSGMRTTYKSEEVLRKLKELFNIVHIPVRTYGIVKLDKNYVNPHKTENTIYTFYVFVERVLIFIRDVVVYIINHTIKPLLALAKTCLTGRKLC